MRELTREVLADLLAESGLDSRGLEILERRDAGPEGRHEAEIVTCRLAGGRRLELFCKQPGPSEGKDFGHRGGVRYEGQVYQRLLSATELTTAPFYGVQEEDGRARIVLGFLPASGRVSRSADPGAVPRAAEWIGRFGAWSSERTTDPDLSFLIRYHAAFYRGWFDRTRAFASGLADEFPWLSPLCDRADEIGAILVGAPQTVVHGEYYPANVLAAGRSVYPVDWESAAIGPGEIDLAALTDRWSAEWVETCEREYVAARWGGHAPAAFHRVLAAARLYLQARWLGERHDWTAHPAFRWRFDAARAAADELGLLP